MRRTGNHLLLFIIIFFSIYPTFAEYMPGLLQGPGSNLQEAATFHMLTTDSVFGVPLRAVGDFAIGFIIFGVVLLNTGGGTFFINLSLAILGRSRGGPAKVAVVASGFFGSLSGSAVANVVTTGSFTIPAMIKIGYDREKAGAIEACASTGGILMPPIMGAAGFVMAAFLDIPYSAVALGAAIPSFLFYFGLFVQIDANAAKSGLKGYAASELPRLRDTLKHGWIYLVSIAVMMYFLFWLDQVGQSAFYAIVALMMLSQVYQDTRLSLGNAGKLVFQSGVFICELVVLLAGVGFILGSLTFTGVAPTFARELVRMAGDSVLLMLIFGAVASFVLGMGMTSIACYIFLAITLAPSLVAMGINEFAAHMFVLYWGIVSFITPPVAFASIAAAVIARVPAVKVGIESMKFGIVLYFIPFFFVYGPALVLQGTVAEIIRGFISAVMGTFLVASGIQGYLLGAGSFGVVQNSYLRFGLRLLLICGGVMLVFYGWFTDICGVGIALSIYLLLRARKGVCVGKHVVNGVN